MLDFDAARIAMVDCQVRPSDVTRYPIIAAMLKIRREEFVPANRREVAYAGEHVMLSPDRVVLDARVFAKILDALAISPNDLVLNIGCGLGYSAAVIALLAEAVVAVEENLEFAGEAAQNLINQSIDNAVVHEGLLAEGDVALGPYDVLVFEGAVEAIPDSLLDQVKDGGRIGAIFLNGALGQVRIGVKTGDKVSWRHVFDATAPLLPGFAKAVAFQF